MSTKTQFTLRPYKKSDASSLAKHANDKAVGRNMGSMPYPYKLKDAQDFLKKVYNARRHKVQVWHPFVIDVLGQAVGSINIYVNKKNNKATMGYWLGREYWGRGIMTGAIKEITDYGFKKLKLKRIEAQVFLHNPASKRVLEKNGFKLEGIMRKGHLKNGKYLDTYLMAKVK